jgi:hypothetical protein
MQSPVYLPQGHHELGAPVVDCEVDHSNVHLENVVLTASIESGPGKPMFALQRGITATTLAFRMDRQAAMRLHGRLSELARSMGWLPKAED